MLTQIDFCVHLLVQTVDPIAAEGNSIAIPGIVDNHTVDKTFTVVVKCEF